MAVARQIALHNALLFFSFTNEASQHLWGCRGEGRGAGLPLFTGVKPAQRFSNNAKEEKPKVRSIKNRLGQDRSNLGFLEN